MTAGQPEQPGSGSEGVVDAILAYLNDQDLLTPQDVRAALQREVDAAGPAAVLALKARLAEDNGWDRRIGEYESLYRRLAAG